MKNRFCCFVQSFLSWLLAAALSVPFVSAWHSGTCCLSDAAGAAMACSPLTRKHNTANSRNLNTVIPDQKTKKTNKAAKAIPVHSCSLEFITTLFLIQILYILEYNPHPFYSFRGLKNQMRIRIACGLDSRSWAGFWEHYRAAVRAIRTIRYNNLLFYLLFSIYNILYNIYNLLFIRLAVITHNWIIIRHPVTIISCGVFVPLAVKWPLHTWRVSWIMVKALVTSNIIQSVCLVGKGRLKERCRLEPRTNFFFI